MLNKALEALRNDIVLRSTLQKRLLSIFRLPRGSADYCYSRDHGLSQLGWRRLFPQVGDFFSLIDSTPLHICLPLDACNLFQKVFILCMTIPRIYM